MNINDQDLEYRVLILKERDLLEGTRDRMFSGGELLQAHASDKPVGSATTDAAIMEMEMAIATILWMRKQWEEKYCDNQD